MVRARRQSSNCSTFGNATMARMNDPATPSGPGLTGLGKFISFVLVAGLIGLGIYVVTKSGKNKDSTAPSRDVAQSGGGTGESGAGRSAAPQAAKFNSDEVV